MWYVNNVTKYRFESYPPGQWTRIPPDLLADADRVRAAACSWAKRNGLAAATTARPDALYVCFYSPREGAPQFAEAPPRNQPTPTQLTQAVKVAKDAIRVNAEHGYEHRGTATRDVELAMATALLALGELVECPRCGAVGGACVGKGQSLQRALWNSPRDLIMHPARYRAMRALLG
jgi:hypothetical protein